MSTVLRLLCLLLPFSTGLAQVYVPDELAPWEAWVLEGHEYRDCPFYYDRGAAGRGDFLCVWPGALNLDIDERGGRFSQRLSVAGIDAWLPLPGDATHWPDLVSLDGELASVVERDGSPGILVAPGDYRVEGRFAWNERPARLRLPSTVGLVELRVDGERVPRPQIDADGVFLGDSEPETSARDTASVVVHRLVADAVPTRLVTRLSIDVSGGVREARFGPVLPEGFVPVSIASSLPARLDADGRLTVQVRPGRWQLTLVARAADVMNEVTLDSEGLADTEIWSYRGDDRLRVTAAEGLPPVDPARVNVPGEWLELPAFRIQPGERLSILERSRGKASAENALTLERDMWLDFDGEGFTFRDRIGGRMQTDWRLDMQTPFVLASAREAGESLLVTRGAEPGETGVELRRSAVDLEGLARVDARGSLPATGWETRFSEVGANLYLPPGHKLLAAPGADQALGSWTGRWQLLDFFLVLIITIAALRLFGRGVGAIAVLALALSYNEPGAPAWLWLNLLVALALLRVAPAGRLLTTVRVYLGLSAALLVLALVPFLGNQLKLAVYPQLEPQVSAYRSAPTLEAQMMQDEIDAGPAASPMPTEADLASKRSLQSSALEEIVVTGARLSPSNYPRYAANATVQTGPGLPSWQWNSYRLAWSGPVDAGQTLTLIILPRWLVSLLRVATVALLLAFAGALLAGASGRRWRLPGGLSVGRGAAVVLVSIAATFALPADEALAQLPDPGLLKELETRLTRAPDCAPRCAEISAASVEVGADAVRITLTVVALEDVAVPLPGSEDGWRPDAVSLSGARYASVMRTSDGLRWLRVPAGRHSVVATGSVAGVDSVELAFPLPPRAVEVTADGWIVAGLRDRRLVAGSLELSRLREEGALEAGTSWESSRFPPFVAISRSLEIGLDWRVSTTVRRVAPTDGALSMDIPLLPGESVVSDDIDIDDGRVRVSMGANQSSVSWASILPRESPVELRAEASVPWTETWHVGVGSIWHVDFDGVPESRSQDQSINAQTAVFHPRAGESLRLTATRPEAAEGATLAFDSVGLAVEQGARTRTAVLDLGYRSTRGDEHVIRLPEDAEVSRVMLDGQPRSLSAENGALSIPILPGEHGVRIEWRQDVAVHALETTPTVDIGAPAGNVSLGLVLPRNRWLLVTSGPALGPAVLYWSELALLILFAVLLGRIPWTPLRTWHWLLLGLGFSTFNWPVMGIVVLWLLAVGARGRFRELLPAASYNVVQAGMIVITVAALLAIVVSLPMGLLGSPDMHVTGNQSYGNQLRWFADRSETALPVATAVSAPLWIYKLLILVWALWLSLALLRWLPWTWQTFAKDGFFRSRRQDRGDNPA